MAASESKLRPNDLRQAGRIAPQQKHRDVVFLRRIAGEAFDGLEELVAQLARGGERVRFDDRSHACVAEHLARRVVIFVDAVGDQHEPVARTHRERRGRALRDRRHRGERKRRGRKHAAFTALGAVMKDRPLPRAVIAQCVGAEVEHADERGDEPVFGQVFGELVVHVQDGGVDVGAQPQRHAQHRVHLRHVQRGCQAMARCVGEDQRHAGRCERDVERVASGQVRGTRHAVDLIALDHRHHGGQRRRLDLARHLELAAHLLAVDQRLGRLRPLQCDCALRRERCGQRFIGLVEHAPALVQDLEHADELVLLVDQRQDERAARVELGAPVHVAVEARVGVAIGDVDDDALLRARAHEAGISGTRTCFRSSDTCSTSSWRSGSCIHTDARSASRTCVAAATTSSSIVIRSTGAASRRVTASSGSMFILRPPAGILSWTVRNENGTRRCRVVQFMVGDTWIEHVTPAV